MPYLLTIFALILMSGGCYLMVYCTLVSEILYNNGPLLLTAAYASFLLLCGGGFLLNLFILHKCNQVYVALYLIGSIICVLICIYHMLLGLFLMLNGTGPIRFSCEIVVLILMGIVISMLLFASIRASVIKRRED